MMSPVTYLITNGEATRENFPQKRQEILKVVEAAVAAFESVDTYEHFAFARWLTRKESVCFRKRRASRIADSTRPRSLAASGLPS